MDFNPLVTEFNAHLAAMTPALQGVVAKMGGQPQAATPAAPPATPAPGMLLPHPDAGPPPAPIGMESQTPPLTMPSQTPQLVTGPKRGQEMMTNGQQVHQGTILGDQTDRTRLLDEGPPVDNIYHNITTSGFGQNHPFLGKLLGGVAEVSGKIGDTLANAAPGIAREIPGTTVRHNMLLGQENTRLGQDVGNAQKEAQTANENATAGKTAAETPEVVPEAEAKIGLEGAQASAVPSEIAERGAQTAHLGAETADMQAGKPMESSAGLLQVKPDGTAQRITVDGQPVGPPIKTEVKQFNVNGKPHQVLIDSLTGDHLRDMGESGERAPTVNIAAQGEKAFEYSDKALTALSNPISQVQMRMGRLKDTIAQGSPQADALIGPELLTIMAGGQGSGLRMNEAEIARIVGGRSVWENLKASIQHWSTNPETANSITADQRKQIRALVSTVDSKLIQKQNLLNTAGDNLLDAKTPEDQHRIIIEARHGLAKIDAGENGAAQPQGAPEGASDEVYAADGKTLIGHVVNGKYVALGGK
jgi:hypothetical protein